VHPSRPIRLLVAGVATLALLAGCQSESAANRQPYLGATTAAATDGVQDVTLVVGTGFRFTPSTVTVHPGKVKITLKYVGNSEPHNWQLVGFPGDFVPLTTAGETNSTTFTAPAPGKYQFECTIHVKQGQVGTLIVLPS
jgi:plastocyanin